MTTMMMSCDKVRAILAGEREDDLSTDESAHFTAHLETCAVCADALSAAEAGLRSLVSSHLAGATGQPGTIQMADAPVLAAAAWARVDSSLRETVAKYPAGLD